MAESVPAPERLVASYKRLAASAENLNTLSEEFSKSVAAIDAALKKLNLGVIAWETFFGADDDDGTFLRQMIGYARINGTWGIAIRESAGNRNSDQPSDIEEWLFNDAPRSLRIDALDKLPELLDVLVKNADKTTKKIQEKTAQAKEIATGLKLAMQEVEHRAKGRTS
jgi:prefoldin subunit 5